MNYQQQLASLLGGRLIAFNVKLSKALGDDIPSALFLGQLLYWWDKGSKPDKIWKIDKDFYEECGLTSKQCKRIRNKLVSLGLLIIKREGIPAKNYYYLNINNISEFINNWLTREDERDSLEDTKGTNRVKPKGPTITKNTQKITTKDINVSGTVKSGKTNTTVPDKPLYSDIINNFFGDIKRQDVYKDWQEAFPDVCNDRELAKAKSWLVANKNRRKKDLRKFVFNWLTKAQEAFDRKSYYKRGYSYESKRDRVFRELGIN